VNKRAAGHSAPPAAWHACSAHSCPAGAVKHKQSNTGGQAQAVSHKAAEVHGRPLQALFSPRTVCRGSQTQAVKHRWSNTRGQTQAVKHRHACSARSRSAGAVNHKRQNTIECRLWSKKAQLGWEVHGVPLQAVLLPKRNSFVRVQCMHEVVGGADDQCLRCFNGF
jgi:hypothetical protein